MSGILAFLTSRLGAFISAGLALSLAVSLAIAIIVANTKISDRDDTITRQGTQILGLQRDLATSRANAATLEAAVEHQNAAIQAQAAAAAQRDADLTRVASQARQDAETAQQRAAAILARPRTGNACADADAAILDAIH